MEGISDLKIIGFDAARLPRIIKEPYINLYFKLIHAAPKRWCDMFNDQVANGDYSIKIDPLQGEFIETWVRKPEEIAAVLTALKSAVKICIANYIDKINAETAADSASKGDTSDDGEQGNLNRIIAGLNFKDS